MFHVGQRVVCVDDSPDWVYGKTFLTLNAVYTIADLSPYRRFTIAGGRSRESVGVRVAEIDISNFGAWWAPERFRPVVERKTDISIFTEMLTPREFAHSNGERT